MNHSNKDGELSAESEEGRPLIKEKAGPPNTCPTQSGKGVSQGLAGVRKAARANKEMKFTALLHHLSISLLRESFYSLKRKAAAGVDDVTWQEYEAGVEDWLSDSNNQNTVDVMHDDLARRREMKKNYEQMLTALHFYDPKMRRSRSSSCGWHGSLANANSTCLPISSARLRNISAIGSRRNDLRQQFRKPNQ